MQTYRLIKQPIVALPDGSRILSFWVVNRAGHRIGKATGDLNEETEAQIKIKHLAYLAEWCGWSPFDRNSHAVRDGLTVCGVALQHNTPLVYDPVTACPECRQILAKENTPVFLG